MMWQYADWRGYSSDAERLARLRLHIVEVTQKIGPDVSGGNMSVASGSLTSLLNMLIEEERMLAAVVGDGNGGGGGTYVVV
ncbi:MAG: hypothetical protein ACK5MB_00065 [Phycisphaerales bacterium]|jgi:hypothetical protein